MQVRRIEAPQTTAKNVAAYARVSTLSEEQEESYNTQVEYYTRLIDSTPGWNFVKVYADQGVSGSQMKSRPGFRQMLEDARMHRFDLLLVKSISRFARNAMEANELIHQMRDLRVEVRFDRENISSADPSADMLLSVLASIAQEEIRATSERVKWSYRRQMEKGVRHLGSNRILGYDERDGVLVPNGDAWIVRKTFELYADGRSVVQIADTLNELGARQIHGGKGYQGGQIVTMLRNMTYVGDRLLQKLPPMDYLTHRPDWTQDYDSVYLSDDHEGIVSRELWDKVQKRLEEVDERRSKGIYLNSRANWLYGKLFCECGCPYSRITEHLRDGRVAKWKCSDRRNGRRGHGCKGYIWREDDLYGIIAEELGCPVEELKDNICRVDSILAKADGTLLYTYAEVSGAGQDGGKPPVV